MRENNFVRNVENENVDSKNVEKIYKEKSIYIFIPNNTIIINTDAIATIFKFLISFSLLLLVKNVTSTVAIIDIICFIN